MKKRNILPLWTVILLILIIGISEIAIRVLSFTKGYIYIGDLALFFWGVLLFSGGVFSSLSYFLETKWSAFRSLIWVYKTILPIGGRINAIIIGIGGILTGLMCIIKVFNFHFFL